MLAAGEQIWGYPVRGHWEDIGRVWSSAAWSSPACGARISSAVVLENGMVQAVPPTPPVAAEEAGLVR